MGRGIGAFVKIAAPDGAGGRGNRSKVVVQNVQRDAGDDGPGDGFGYFRINELRQGVATLNPVAEVLRQLDDRASFGAGMEMKEDRAAAIHLQIEIASGDIGTGRKKEFDATVAADTLLVPCGHGPDISVLDPEQHEDGRGIIDHFHLRFREVFRPFPHMVAE